MQNLNEIKLVDIVNVLNMYFEVSLYRGKDISFTNRMRQHFDTETISRFESDFIENCNGLMIKSNKNTTIKEIYGAPFLSDDVLEKLLKNCCSDSLLIVHHPLDINCGIDKAVSLIGYNSVSKNQLYSFLDRGNSIYSLHLPLDLNKYKINTHYALFQSLAIDATIIDNLIKVEENELGYILETPMIEFKDIMKAVNQVSSNSFIVNNESKITNPIGRIGLIAGMVNSISQLKQIEDGMCEICICGDIYIRDGERRYLEMMQEIKKCPIPFICMSHNISEGQVFRYGLFPYLKTLFPILIYKDIECNKFK